jgi:hypothetical protein
MYPDGLAALARADDYEQVKAVAEYYAEYAALFDGSGSGPGDKTLEDKFFEHEVGFQLKKIQNYLTIFSHPGQTKRLCIHPTIPFWRLLLVLEAQRTRMSQHCVDR